MPFLRSRILPERDFHAGRADRQGGQRHQGPHGQDPLRRMSGRAGDDREIRLRAVREGIRGRGHDLVQDPRRRRRGGLRQSRELPFRLIRDRGISTDDSYKRVYPQKALRKNFLISHLPF